MTKPYTLYEQQGHNWFKPKHRLAFIFGMSKFDACWRRDKKGNLVRAFNDLENAKTDCTTLIDCLRKYEILEEDIIDCSDDPSFKKVDNELAALSKRLRKGKQSNPVENYLIIFLFAGHGILKSGMQCLLYNEYDPRNKFYKILMAEAKLRGWAEIYPNSYIIGIFACCRQLYDQPTMSGFYSKAEADKFTFNGKTVGMAPLHVTQLNQEVFQFKKAYEQFQKATKAFKDEVQKQQQMSLEKDLRKSIYKHVRKQTLAPAKSFYEPVQPKLAVTKPVKRVNTQQYGYCAEEIAQNLCLLFGARPSHSVMANTSMVKDITDMMTSEYSNDTLSLKVPDCFDYLTAKDGDTKFETVTSNGLQPLNMIFSHNVVTKTVAYIFTFDECRGCKVKGVKERGNKAIELFQGVFEFQEVCLFHNLSKDEVIEKLKDLKQQASNFEKNVENKEKRKVEDLKAIPDKVKKIWAQLNKKELESMDFETAFKCTNLIAQESTTVNWQTKQKFTDDFARLDFDGDNDVSINEMIRYEQGRLHSKQLFLAGICWIGRSVGDPEEPFYKQEFQEKASKQEEFPESQEKYYPWFELNNLGEPICINEYATDIASGPNSHILHLDDFNPDNDSLTTDNIVADGDFQEKFLRKGREGRNRQTFITECNIETMYVLFNNQKENSQVFVIPHHIQETNMVPHIWPTVSHRQQIFLDLRTEIDKANVRLSRFVNTFRKSQCNVWQDQPKIVNYEQCYEKRWQPSVHNIANQMQIVQITGDVDNPDKITLTFYSYVTYIEKSRVSLDIENFTSAMIVNENRPKVKGKKETTIPDLGGQLGLVFDFHIKKELLGAFFVVLFTQNQSPKVCRLYKFYHQPSEKTGKTQPSEWKFKKAEAVSPEQKQAGFLNAFRIRGIEKDYILLVTCFRYLIYNEELELIHVGKHSEFEPQAKRLLSFSQGQTGYLLGFDLNSTTAAEKKIKNTHVYRNERNYEGENSWVVRCTFEEVKFKFECTDVDKRKKSLLLKDEVIYTILEYAPDKMIVSLKLTNLLIVNKWEPLKMIAKNSMGNIQKYYFDPLPDFDEQKFPFIACSGYEHISLVNVRDMTMQIFVQVPCRSVKSQQAFFFKEEKYGSSLHFCSKQIQEGGKELHMWYQLELKKDFNKQLRHYAKLPVNMLQAKQEISAEIEQYRIMKEELFPDQYKGRELTKEMKKLNTPNSKVCVVNDLKNKLAMALNPLPRLNKQTTLGADLRKLHLGHLGSGELQNIIAEERKRDKPAIKNQRSLQHEIKNKNSLNISAISNIVELDNVDETDSINTSNSLKLTPNESSQAAQEVNDNFTVEPHDSPGYESSSNRPKASQHQEETKEDNRVRGHNTFGYHAPQVNATNVARNDSSLSKIEEMLSQHGQMMTKLIEEQQKLKEQASKRLYSRPVATKPVVSKRIKAKTPAAPLTVSKPKEVKKPLQIDVMSSTNEPRKTNQLFSSGGFSTPRKKLTQRPQSAKNAQALAFRKEVNSAYTIKNNMKPYKFHQLTASQNAVRNRSSSSQIVSSPSNKHKQVSKRSISTTFSPKAKQIEVEQLPHFLGLTSPLNMTPSSQSKRYASSSYQSHPFENMESALNAEILNNNNLRCKVAMKPRNRI